MTSYAVLGSLLSKRVTVGFGVLGLSFLASSAFAQRKYGTAGCGLGSIVFKPGSGQISAATTNATGASNLFGITSGTSNCLPDAAGMAMIEQETFVAANYGALSKEMAQGEGSTVAGLANVLGCEANVYPQFASFAQSKYSEVFAAPGMMAMLDQLKLEMAQNPQLSAQCKYAAVN